MNLNSQLGKGGAGMHGTGPGTAADTLRSLTNLRISLAAGAAANTKLAIAAMRPGDSLLSVLNNNAGTLTDVSALATIADLRATGTVTCAGTQTVGDTLSVAGLVYTVAASGADVEPQDKSKVRATGNATTFAAALAAAINAREDGRTSKVTATAAAGVVTVTAVEQGASGNAIALAETGSTFTISGAALAGGSDTGGVSVNAVTNQVVVYWLQQP